MMKVIKKLFRDLKISIQNGRKQNTYSCRIIAIEKDKKENYLVITQLTNKSEIIKMKPEEILADDKLTDCFSPRDVRTLTYLGYLGINTPKYKILAQRLSQTDNHLIFALQERSSDTPIIKTASEISMNDEILSSLHPKDAHRVGYLSASERETIEAEQKKKLLASHPK